MKITAPLLLIAAVISISVTANKQNSESNLSSCPTNKCSQSETYSTEVYFAFQPSSKKTVVLLDDLIYSVSRQLRNKPKFNVDLMIGDRVNTLFAKVGDRQTLIDVRANFDGDPNTVELDPIASSDRALIQSFNRFKNLAIANNGRYPFHAYIVTPGTTDPDSLAAIGDICEQLAQNLAQSDRTTRLPLNLSLIIVDSANRGYMTTALHPIGSILDSSSSYKEWIQSVKELK